jgi:hypothetical protein
MVDEQEIDGIEIHCVYSDMADIEVLKRHNKNPRRHPEQQVVMLAKMILKSGWRNPIVVSERSGMITKGHGRLLAAKRLGMQRVPVDYQDYESEEMEVADVIADNRIPELSEMDSVVLKEVLLELDTGALDMDLTGFDLPTLETLMTAAPPVTKVPPNEEEQTGEQGSSTTNNNPADEGMVRYRLGKLGFLVDEELHNDLVEAIERGQKETDLHVDEIFETILRTGVSKVDYSYNG